MNKEEEPCDGGHILAQRRSKLLIPFSYLAAALILTAGYRAITATGDMRHSPAPAQDHCNGSFIQYSQVCIVCAFDAVAIA